ncbi:hypothetical protein GGR57DRAFT_279270 [Xylariaceae sp. FL1272]|nr:hypothetical protein GGR57DRAFT_279270 [Xylariaceae sp. FL1272]
MFLELRDVDFRDGSAIQQVYISAFHEDTFNMTLFPGMSYDRLLAGAISRWPRAYGEFGGHYKKVVDTETGDVVSYSKWRFTNSDAVGVLPQQSGLPEGFVASPPRTPEGLDDPFAIKFTDKCRAGEAEFVGDRPCMELKLMGTLPSFERKGAGSLMLDWATKFADEKGLVCWVVASPKGLPLYQKYGFEAKKAIVMPVIDGSMYTYTCMMRECKKPE